MKNTVRLQKAKFRRDYAIARGTRPTDAIASIVKAPVVGGDDVDLTLPTIVFPRGERMWSAAERIAESIGCTLQVEEMASHEYRVRLATCA